MATNFSPVLGVLCFKLIPKYCDVWCEGTLRICQWSDTGLSWSSCLEVGKASVTNCRRSAGTLPTIYGLRPNLYTSPTFRTVSSTFSPSSTIGDLSLTFCLLPSMHCRLSANSRPMASKLTNRLIVDLSQITRRQLHDVSLRSRQPIQTSAVFPWQQIGRAPATTRRRSAVHQRLTTDCSVIQMPTNCRLKEIATVGA